MPRVLQRGHIDVQDAEVSDIRVLKRADLQVLTEKRPSNFVQTLRDSHHRIARAVAAGLPNGEVAATCGISYNRVSTLKADPAFSELVAHYRGLITAEYIRSIDNFMEVATSNMLKAETMLSDKIDAAIESGEALPTRDLIAITSDRADRFGYGKTQKNLNVNIDFAANLERARKRSTAARIIEGTATSPHATNRPSNVEPGLPKSPAPRTFRRV